MSGAELSLNFSSQTEVNVSFGDTESGKLTFANPVTEKHRSDIRWYVETYGSSSLAEPDDEEAHGQASDRRGGSDTGRLAGSRN